MEKHRKCTICGEPVVLVPSAAERARQSGLPAAYYLNLFTSHSDCFIAKRERETNGLIRRSGSRPRPMPI